MTRQVKRGQKKGNTRDSLRGVRIGSRRRKPGESYHSLDKGKTINSAIGRHAHENINGNRIHLNEQDLYLQIRSQRPRRLIIFTVDTSDSMGDGPIERMSAALGAIVSLASMAYLNRDQICLITFRDRDASLVIPPTSSVTLIRQQLHKLPVGGATPLPAALQKVKQIVTQEKRKNPMLTPLMVLISDGAATMASEGGKDPDKEALDLAEELNHLGISALLIDTLPSRSKRGNMNQIARIFGCSNHHIQNLQADTVLKLINETETEDQP